MSDPGRQRWKLILLVLIFAAPMTVSSVLYFFTDVGRADRGEHGELVMPPVLLPDLTLIDPGGPAAHLHGKWTLLLAVDGNCDAECESSLYMLRQLRLALGKNIHRVQRVLVVNAAPDQVLSAAQRGAWPGQLLLDGRTTEAGAAVPVDGAVYLCDPLGNLMMRYPAGTPPEGIVRDLKRLLHYSRIG